jgi:hypothetical protein
MTIEDLKKDSNVILVVGGASAGRSSAIKMAHLACTEFNPLDYVKEDEFLKTLTLALTPTQEIFDFNYSYDPLEHNKGKGDKNGLRHQFNLNGKRW